MIILPATIATLLLSYLFVVGGCQKLGDPANFQHVVSDYKIFQETWSPLLARLLPFIEVCAGLALLVPVVRGTALVLLAALLATYTAAIAINIFRGRLDIDCGCAGPGQEQTISTWLLGRNTVLMLSALLAYSAIEGEVLGPVGWSIAFLGTALAALMYHAFNQLIANKNLLQRIAHHG